MEMRETGALKVLSDFNFPEHKVVINPNDGFDIGLMMTEAQVQLMVGSSVDLLQEESAPSMGGHISQKNECRLGTVELSSKLLEKIGSPPWVRLHLVKQSSEPKLLITPV